MSIDFIQPIILEHAITLLEERKLKKDRRQKPEVAIAISIERRKGKERRQVQ